MPHTRVSFEMREKAKAGRRFMTKGESLLWYELRALKAEGLKFRRQAPIGPYIADFACFEPKLIVEVDGDQQETEKGKRHDANRDSYFHSLGYRILRFDAPDVLTHAWHVAQVVMREAEHCRGNPTRPLRGHCPSRGSGRSKLEKPSPWLFAGLKAVASHPLKGEGEVAL